MQSNHLSCYKLKFWAFLVAQSVKKPASMQEIQDRPLGQEDCGGRHGNPLQYSCLMNPTDRGVWWATAHRLTRVGQDWSDRALMHKLNY